MSEPHITYADLITILNDVWQRIDSVHCAEHAIYVLKTTIEDKYCEVLAKQAEYASEEHQRYHNEPHGGAS